ncbi:MAG TPA: phosphatidate cytidylyltransferase [Woeseiaceae bacterium]|jgi:phosphatidate cytidylyltransferase|nr:phosphatidate cytidylyltransferase [Woeseiaceae bacterium]
MLKQRIVTSIASLLIVGLVLFVLPVVYAEFIIGILVLGGAWEWSGFLGTTSNKQRFGYTMLVGICIALAHVSIPTRGTLVLQVACAWWFIAFFWNLRFPTPIPAIVRWICGVVILVPLFVALVMLLRLGVEYLLFTLLIVWLADGGAYFAGKAFGRVKLAPGISPGKTWEGVVGGMLLVVVLALAGAVYMDASIAVLLPFCLAVGALSVVGDLTVSMFKRTVGLKDSGSLFPGHGGVLDRIDSLSAAAPLFALGVTWLGIA